jgi:hypothetical protein
MLASGSPSSMWVITLIPFCQSGSAPSTLVGHSEVPWGIEREGPSVVSSTWALHSLYFFYGLLCDLDNEGTPASQRVGYACRSEYQQRNHTRFRKLLTKCHILDGYKSVQTGRCALSGWTGVWTFSGLTIYANPYSVHLKRILLLSSSCVIFSFVIPGNTNIDIALKPIEEQRVCLTLKS